MSIFSEVTSNTKYKPEPKSVGITIEDQAERYMDKFNGKVKITKKEEIMNGESKGSIILHMTNARLSREGMEIRDIFPRKKAETPFDTWIKTQINRVTGAMKSAGMKIPAEVSASDLDGCLDSLVGKEVTISQWTPEGSEYPRINYKFNDGNNLSDEQKKAVEALKASGIDLSNLPM